MVEVSAPQDTSAAIQQVFKSYTGKETTLEGKQFAKLIKDLKILDKKVTSTDIDLIFAKIKDKAARRISFTEFMNGLDLVAQRKGMTGI